MSAPASRAAIPARISVPRFVESIFVASCMVLLPLSSQDGCARRQLRRIVEITSGVARALRVPRYVLDEVAGDVALRDGDGAGTRIAVRAHHVEGSGVYHRDDRVPASAEAAEGRDDQRDDALVVDAEVGPVDRGGAGARAAEDAIAHPLLDLPDRAACLSLHALPRLRRAPERVVVRARERRIDLVGPVAAVRDLVAQVRNVG